MTAAEQIQATIETTYRNTGRGIFWEEEFVEAGCASDRQASLRVLLALEALEDLASVVECYDAEGELLWRGTLRSPEVAKGVPIDTDGTPNHMAVWFELTQNWRERIAKKKV